MVVIPKKFTDRIEDLNKQLDFAVMFNDVKRIEYLNNQISRIEEKIQTRIEVSKE